MRNLIKILAILISILVFCFCNKEETEQKVITYPTIVTSSATEITRTTAVTGGSITSDGGSNIIAKGVCWRANAVPTLGHYRNTYDGKGMGSFISVITELSPNTTYFIRAYATNSLGTEYGDTISFTTQPAIDPTSIPILRTFEVTSITENCATSGGFMTYENVNEVVDTISTRGVCWSTTPNPTIEDSNSVDGKGKGSFISCLTGLEPLTTYYIRAYSINNLGVGYGDQITFTTLASIPTGTVTDIEGNVYKTIIIGEQTWMAENLKTTHFKDGSTIPIVTTDTYQWDNSQTPNYCWYNYDEESYKDIYGALYNWHTVNTGNICPEGWRIPTYNDWITLITFLGGDGIAGTKLKAPCSIWSGNYFNTTNESGFTGLPGGGRYGEWNPEFRDANKYGYWWSSSGSGGYAYGWMLMSNLANIGNNYYLKRNGFSIRCVKN